MTRSYRVMGIVNVTPDSFSDGGEFLDSGLAVEHAHLLHRQGADILDVGGESTRPGAEPVTGEQELRRVLPVLEGLARGPWDSDRPGASARPRVSIDTSKASVARAAIAAGADLVNDVTALRADPEMVGVVAEHGVEVCLMHMLGEPRTMQREPRYDDVVDDVKAFLEQRLSFATHAGVSEQRIMLDPGIGFGKTLEHNLQLLCRLRELTSLGRPVVVGTSRKSFIGRLLADAAGEDAPLPVQRRLAGTIATNVLALQQGASVFRVHDVQPVADALAVAAATLGARWSATAATAGTTQTS